MINNCYALRAAIVNHRSKFSDFDLLVQTTLQIGRRLLREKGKYGWA
jgi:hypothetical protein